VTVADQIWNRAALERGGAAPRSGDRALASLLLVHGLVMNGGVHHALESAEPAELAAAADGFDFFGFYDVAALFRPAADESVLSKWTHETEVTANLRYETLIPSDSYLNARFKEVLGKRAAEFAPL
jgi:hypothetical protein